MKIHGKDEIIKTATEIIAFSGLDKLTMQSLAAELGMNKASLYHWFHAKEEIVEEIFKYGHKALMAKGFKLSLEGNEKEVLERAASGWSGIFSDESILPYLRVIFSLRYSDERAEEEARALNLMIKSQIDVIMTRLGYSDPFLSALFSSLLLQHLESVLEGNDVDFNNDAASFASFITSIQDKGRQ